MAYILLALGALMSLVGLAAMVTGYPIIEVERGWASVIAGAVLLSGGVVVAALGLVVRNLVGLRRALAVDALPAGTPIPQPAVVPTPLTSTQPATPTSALTERPSLPHPLGPAAGPLLAAAVPPAAAILAAGAAYAHETRPAEPDPHPLEAPSHADMDEAATEPHHPESNETEIHGSAPDAEPTEAHDEVHELLDHHHEPAQDAAEADRPRSTNELLDEAFSAFDYEMATSHSSAAQPHPAAREPEPAAHEESPQQVPVDEPLPVHEPAMSAHEAEPEPAAVAPEPEAPATAPAEPAANLAIIGRYDSEGTSYVMYSDGSIEAQSDAGVYRFNSMAELKAFIEG